MTGVEKGFEAQLRRAVSGSVWVGLEAGERARGALWNGGLDVGTRALVECRDLIEVQRVVRVAAEEALPVAVLGGGHDWRVDLSVTPELRWTLEGLHL